MDSLESVAHLANVPLVIEIELDRTMMTVRDILDFSTDSILRMSRSAGDNVDIRIGGALAGYGEIVILEDKMGIRITDFHEAV
jgi:flagellar motor switch protein FliN/FliY